MAYDNIKGIGDYNPPEPQPQFVKMWQVKIESCNSLKYENPRCLLDGLYDLDDIRAAVSAINSAGKFEFINGCTCDANESDLNMVAECQMVEI